MFTQLSLYLGTDGIGKQGLLTFAKHNPARIYFTGRNQRAADEIIEEGKLLAPLVEITFLRCDLGSKANIRSALLGFVSDRLDILILCAGIMATPPDITTDGYEVQFGVNHIGHAALLKLLLPTLLKTALLPGADVRLITLTSLMHQILPHGGISFDDLQTAQENRKLGAWGRYAQSKLANTLYGQEMARRYPSIKSIIVHPGIVNTNLGSHSGFISRTFLYITTLGGLLALSPRSGSDSFVWAATADSNDVESGVVYTPVGNARIPAEPGLDRVTGTKLWEWTEKVLQGFDS